MGEIIEIAEGRRATSLGDSIDVSGIEDGSRVLDQYLGDEEEPKYVLKNGQRGIAVEDEDGRQEIEPSANRQGIVVLTDVRTLFVVGGAGDRGDRVVTIPYVEIVAVRREESFFSDRLVVATTAEQWEFPFKGDLEEPEAYMKQALSAWSGARTAIETFRQRMSDALDRLDAEEFDDALDRADAAESALMRAESRLEKLGAGALESLSELAAEEDVATLRARVHRERGEKRYERARTALDEESYHEAYEAMTAARDAFRHAAEIQPESLDDDITDRLGTVESDLDDLTSRPLREAKTAYDDALDLDGMARAIALEESLEKYRDALSVCWGERGKQFDGDPQEIRERIIEIVEGIYESWTNLAWERLVDGDAYADQNDPDRAQTHYEDARSQLENARDVTRELHPDLDADLDPWFEAVDDRLRALDDPSGGTDPVAERTPEVNPLSAGIFDRPIRMLNTSDLIETFADFVTQNGWSTTTVVGGDDPYDLIASRCDPFEVQVLVRVVAEETPSTRHVDRLADAAEGTPEADIAVLVAPDIPPPVRDCARDRGVKILDADRLSTILDSDQSVESGAAV